MGSISEFFGGIEVSREIFADYKSNLSIVTRHIMQLVVQRVWLVGLWGTYTDTPYIVIYICAVIHKRGSLRRHGSWQSEFLKNVPFLLHSPLSFISISR